MSARTTYDRPKRAEGVRLVRQDGVAYLNDSDGAQLLALNDTAAALWELCDGRTSVDEMAAAAASLFDASPERISADVAETVSRLRSVGALQP
jgi:hypothetical protein